MFTDFPSETPIKSVREKWLRDNKRRMTADMKAVMNDQVPAKLEAETETVDINECAPELGEGATEGEKARVTQLRAKLKADNDRKTKYREKRTREIKDHLASELEAAMETNARLMFARFKTLHQMAEPYRGMYDGKAMWLTIAAEGDGADIKNISTDMAEKAFQKLKAEPLRDGCSADELSERCNRFIRDPDRSFRKFF